MLALLSLAALCGASSPQSTSAPSKPATKKVAKKRVARKPVRKPAPPSAEIPMVAESASIWRGCLESHDLPKLATSLGMEPTRLAAQLEELGSPASQSSGCIAYVAATGGEAGAASVIFRVPEPGGEARTLAFQKTADGVIATPGVCDCREATRRVVSMPAQDYAASINADSLSLPENVRWQLNILVPRMMTGLSAKRATPVTEEGHEAGNPSRTSPNRRSITPCALPSAVTATMSGSGWSRSKSSSKVQEDE